MAEKELEKIYIPKNYDDVIRECPHMVVRSESVMTCNMALQNPKNYIGKQVTCSKCNTTFNVVEGEPPAEQAHA